jgi:hypothetical protein
MMTLATRIFDLLHAGVSDQLAGLCLLVWGACGAATAVVARLLQTRRA